ncbi:MAG: 3-deoxy-manno-octulosonate cytidylyltransferase [Bacteroidota bacterium]|jgi:3-deoxy-manno-octulosonate cytidylyltransferase (CMP-KDO synthetase)
MNAICIIPARLQSTRLPEKLLMSLGDFSIVEHVYRNCVRANVFTKVLIAVDDHQMFEHCAAFCDDVIMTRKGHQSGTDRIYEAYQQSGIRADYIVNVQADEPFLNSEHIAILVQSHSITECDVMTAMTKIDNMEELFSPSCVKIVLGQHNRALYFSRSPIPFLRDIPKDEWIQHHDFMKHIGVYSYTESSLQAFVNTSPSRLEITEKLEQLRLLEQGHSYTCIELNYDGFGIDTIEDYQKAIERITRE